MPPLTLRPSFRHPDAFARWQFAAPTTPRARCPRVLRAQVRQRAFGQTARDSSHGPEWISNDTGDRVKVVKYHKVLQYGHIMKALSGRGFIHQLTGRLGHLEDVIETRRPGAYVGIDPTAPSLHVGHIVPLMALFWMVAYGLRGVILVGRGTAEVGDPSGRLTTRDRLRGEQLQRNAEAIKCKIEQLWPNFKFLVRKYLPCEDIHDSMRNEGSSGRTLEILDNASWLNDLSLLEFLTTMGHSQRLGSMLSRDTVVNRLNSSDGMSFAEFTYPLIQAWDWWYLMKSTGENKPAVQIQIGGSDQFGNIVTGLNALKAMIRDDECLVGRHNHGKDPIGFTVPLLTTPSGEKFGKSSGNAVWLDEHMTKVFDLYGYFVSIPDPLVESLLKLLTFIPLSAITTIMTEHVEAPQRRVAQHRLAFEFVTLVHGQELAYKAAKEHGYAFGQTSLAKWDPSAADFKLNPKDVANRPLKELLVEIGLVHSKSRATQTLKAGGIYLGVKGPGERIQFQPFALVQGQPFDPRDNPRVKEKWVWDNGMLIFRLGKKTIVSIHVTEDVSPRSDI